jgi:hypothetical protein
MLTSHAKSRQIKKPSILLHQEDEGDYVAAIVVPPPFIPAIYSSGISVDATSREQDTHQAHRGTITVANRKAATAVRAPVHCLAHGCH